MPTYVGMTIFSNYIQREPKNVVIQHNLVKNVENTWKNIRAKTAIFSVYCWIFVPMSPRLPGMASCCTFDQGQEKIGGIKKK
jgi:hypothetical protein